MTSIILKQFDSPREAIEKINDAHEEFRAVFKKGAKTELAYSECGHYKTPTYHVSLWYTGNKEEFEWFKNYFTN